MPHESDEDVPKSSPLPAATIAVQSRALDAVRDAAGTLGAEQLLKKTGPLAELNAAVRRQVLDEVRQLLIAKKGAGVVFEAKTVVHLQDAAERFQLDLRASLAARVNDPRVDVLAWWAEEQIELQLKVGSDKYIRAAIRSRADGTIIFVPSDTVPQGIPGVTAVLDFDGVVVESPTRQELIDSADASLQRLAVGESQVTTGSIAVTSICSGLVDGLVAAILDLAFQKLARPEMDVDWARAVRVFVKAGSISTVGSFVAAANTMSALQLADHAIDASSLLRCTRVTAAVLPRIVDVGLDLYEHSQGRLSGRDFGRRVTQHAAGATAEYFLFPVIARIAIRCGPIGGILVLLGGGLLVSRLGEAGGGILFDLFEAMAALPRPSLEREAEMTSMFEQAVQKVTSSTTRESKRRDALAARNLCEERACRRPHHARGMCNTHYSRWWRQQRRRYGLDWMRFVPAAHAHVGAPPAA